MTRDTSQQAALWQAVDALIDRAPALSHLRAHRLHLLAARRWRSLGREIQPDLAREELQMAAKTLATRRNLEAARAAYDGTMMAFKGITVGLRYPDPALRPCIDIDLLVDDAPRAQQALLASGFEAVGPLGDEYFVGLQHGRPLVHPAHGRVLVEVHSYPSWVNWAPLPSTAAILARGTPSGTGIDGLLEPAPEDHALILAAHSWASTPLRRASDLVDIAVVAGTADRGAVEQRARDWSLDRLWRTYARAIDGLLLDGPMPSSLRLWGRSLHDTRDATVVENHIRRWVGPFWAQPLRAAFPAASRAVFEDLTPAPEETWAGKSRRIRASARNALRPVSEHTRELGVDGIRPRHKRRSPES